MITKPPTIEDVYNFDSYINTPGVRQGLIQRHMDGDPELILEDTDEGQGVYYTSPYGEQISLGRPEAMLLAAGPSPVVSDAGAAFGVYPGMGKRSQKSGIGDRMITGVPDLAAGGARGFTGSALGLGGDLEKLTGFIGALATDNQGGTVMEKLSRAAQIFENKTFLPSSDDLLKSGYTIPGTSITLPALPGVVPEGQGAFGLTPEQRNTAANMGQSVGELVGDPFVLAKGGKMAVKGAIKAGEALGPKAAEMVVNLAESAGMPVRMGVVPLERYGQVTMESSAMVDSGAAKLGGKVTPEKNLQLLPEYRVKVTGSYTPDGKGQNIVNDVNPGNYQDVSTRLNDLATAFPDPLKSNESFAIMMANVYNSNEVPIPPNWLISNVNDMKKWSSWFGSMSKNQIDEADRGFAVVDKFRNIYQNGTANADTTGTLMFWAMLSRRASAYPHESGFLDLAESMQPLIQKAVRGEYTQADIDTGLKMISQTIPAGSPGNMVTSNANDFLRTFLPKMGEKLPDGRTKLQALHDMVANPQMTGPQIRRDFYSLAEGVGIKNKVLSFALLVSGREDVMVLDRIQINRLFAGGDKIYDDVAHLFDGGPGLATYEALERSLALRVQELYKEVGRADKASIGRYHWESWVLSSGQEVAHPTLETIVKKAEGANLPFANVPVKEGRTHERAFGITYERTPEGGNRFVYETAGGDKVAMTKNNLDEMFNHVMEKKNGVIPDNFPGVKFFSKDTLPDGTPNKYFGKPWYTWPGVNRELIDDFAAAVGTNIPDSGSAGAVPRAVQGGAANRPQRTGRSTQAGQQPSVTGGRQAPQSGAK